MVKIIWLDYLFVIGLLAVFSAGFITNLLMSRMMGDEGLAAVASELEANPVARRAMDLGYGLFALQLLVNSFMVALYLVLRRQWYVAVGGQKEAAYQALTFYTGALSLLYIQNLLNDLPILLGLIYG